MIYQALLRPLLFRLDPEKAHRLMLNAAQLLERLHAETLLRLIYPNVRSDNLKVKIAGIEFPNPIGLAAGMDKDCEAAGFFGALGFGHVEVGTITRTPQPGNPKPRVFRLSEQHAVINRLGFPSQGIATVLPRLEALRARKQRPILGVNIGKSRDTALERAVDDYVYLMQQVSSVADYISVNISSPNTPELRRLQEPARLQELFGELKRSNTKQIPIFVKLSPDLSDLDLEEVVKVLVDCGVSAIIATNTTIDRSTLHENLLHRDESGGLSGAPLKLKSLAVVKKLHQILNGKLPIIGVGGISSAYDANAMFDSGASLIQIYTGLIYQGPALIRSILESALMNVERGSKSSGFFREIANNQSI